uniref:hypothetical protein n=1 Tax=Paractinoplanes polyasparticus TaxID=2856853 RepID=UPI001C84D0F0|nr:hypothetical protein [Actinoplanes polyasparticus]
MTDGNDQRVADAANASMDRLVELTGQSPATDREARGSAWLIPAWALLALLTAGLLSLAVYLLFRTNLFSSEPLTAETIKALWAFLGVALGAVATLIGTLLTEQNNRRSARLARESALRESLALLQRVKENRDAEARLTLDTRTRALELLTHDGDYAPRARVAGAIATMMELQGGPVACRILGELWTAGKVSTSVAVWLLERVINDEAASAADKDSASTALAQNAARLFPAAGSPDQAWHEWPSVLVDAWPSHLPPTTKDGFLYLCIKSILCRDPSYWIAHSRPPFSTLCAAVRDKDRGTQAALVLAKLHDVVPELLELNEEEVRAVRAAAVAEDCAGWYVQLVNQLDAWAGTRDAGPGESPTVAVLPGTQPRPGITT